MLSERWLGRCVIMNRWLVQRMEDDVTMYTCLADAETSYKKRGLYLEHIEFLNKTVLELDEMLEGWKNGMR